MTSKTEIDELARRYLDLWDRQISALQDDADFERHLQTWLDRLGAARGQQNGSANAKTNDKDR